MRRSTAIREGALAAGAARASSRRRLAVPCVLGAVFLAAVNQTVVTTAMPLIVSELGEFARYTTPTVAYLLASAAGMLLAGAKAARFGCGRVIAFGLAVFAAGCLAVSFAPSMTWLIGLRAVEGFGAGCALAGCHVSAVELYDARARGTFQAWVAIVYGLAFLVGPLLGGFLAEHLGWPWIFRIHGLLGVAVLIWAARAYPSAGGPADAAPADRAGIALLGLMLAPALLALIHGGAGFDWMSWVTAALVGVGVAAAGVFVWLELRTEAPVVPLRLYRDPTIAAAAALTALTAFALYGAAFYLPLSLQAVLGVSATASGGFVAPMLLAFVLGAVLSGLAVARTELRFATVIRLNAAGMLAGMSLLAFVAMAGGPLALAACSVVAGIGMGGMLAVLTVAVQQSPSALAGHATAALQVCRLLGGLIGLAVLGGAMGWRFEQRVLGGADAASGIPSDVLETLAANPGLLGGPPGRGGLDVRMLEFSGDERAIASVAESLQLAMRASVGEVFLLCLAATAACAAISLAFREPAPRQPSSGGGA